MNKVDGTALLLLHLQEFSNAYYTGIFDCRFKKVLVPDKEIVYFEDNAARSIVRSFLSLISVSDLATLVGVSTISITDKAD